MSLSFLVDQLVRATAASSAPVKVSRQQYDDWKRHHLFEALQGQRFGRDFCNTFGVFDNILWFETRTDCCERYILKHYIKRR